MIEDEDEDEDKKEAKAQEILNVILDVEDECQAGYEANAIEYGANMARALNVALQFCDESLAAKIVKRILGEAN